MSKFTIVVPGTTANLGVGFDSIGLAVSTTLELEVVTEQEKWEVEHAFGESIPTDEKNLIIQVALTVAPALKPHKVICRSTIPMTRGLGSSSSAIVAGIELANELAQLHLTNQQKVKIATELEGHPDNVAPAILGGLVVASYKKGNDLLPYVQKPVGNLALVAFIPAEELSTEASRGVLPHSLSYADAVLASSVSNTLVAALFAGDYSTMGQVIEQDLFHEPYRSHLVPALEQVREITKHHQVYGTYLSGAGPTVMTFMPKEQQQSVVKALAPLAKQTGAVVVPLEVVNKGVYVK